MDDLSFELNELLTQMLEDEIEQIQAALVHWLACDGVVICDPTVTSELSVVRLVDGGRPDVSALRRDRGA